MLILNSVYCYILCALNNHIEPQNMQLFFKKALNPSCIKNNNGTKNDQT